MKTYYLLALLISLTFGCKRSAPEITAQDIAHALQMHKWTIKPPADCSPPSRVGLKALFKNESKVIATLPTEPSQNTTLFIWKNQDSEQYYIHAICNGSSTFGKLGIQVKPGSACSGWNDETCSVGDKILEFDNGEENFHIEICLIEK
jgi:hypothetical protein